MATEHDLRHQLARYLANEITLRDLMSWVWAVTWEVSYASRTALTVMLESLQLIYQDLTSGVIDEDEVLRRVANLLERSQTSPGRMFDDSVLLDGVTPQTSP